MVSILLFQYCLCAQQTTTREIAFYADASQSAIASKHRLYADSMLQLKIRNYLSSSTSKTDFAQELDWLNVQYTQDSSMRIFSWQLNLNDSAFFYRCFIQNLASQEVFELTELPVIPKSTPYQTLDMEHWYGGIYYDLQEILLQGQQAYLLFGFRIMDGQLKQKFCDVLWFDDSAKPKFGKPIFVYGPDDIRQRITIAYDFKARGYMQYDPKESRILFDHIIEVPGYEGMMRVPDGSYEGFNLQGEKFEYMTKVFNKKIAEKDPFQQYRESNKN